MSSLPLRPVSGPAEILAAAGATPYARFAVSTQRDPAGYAVDGNHAPATVLWFGEGPLGRVGHGVGDPAVLDQLLATASGAGLSGATAWVNLPRRNPDALPAGWSVREDWDLMWLTAEPPPVPGADAVVPVAEDRAVSALLDVAAPEFGVRPGHPLVRQWYGVWQDATLVACALDRSRGAVGVIGSVAVHPRYRRRGFGAAVTAALTARLRAEYELVCLGVMAGNDDASRIYRRLGYRGVESVTSMLAA